MTAAAGMIEADPGYQKAHEELERGSEPPFDSLQRVLLAATDFSPEIVPPAEKPKSPRYFEMRVYHSPTERQLRFLHERFSGAEISIFRRSGVHPILYTDTLCGSGHANFTYVIPFATWRIAKGLELVARPRLTRGARRVDRQGGQIVDYQNMSLWRAAAFSPIL